MLFQAPSLGIYIRIVALLALLLGLSDAARLLGVSLDTMSPIAVLGPAGFTFLAVFCLARLFAAVGLWIKASWGAVLLIGATTAELALYLSGSPTCAWASSPSSCASCCWAPSSPSSPWPCASTAPRQRTDHPGETAPPAPFTPRKGYSFITRCKAPLSQIPIAFQ